MFGRQCRETSRAQASCPCFCCWAEAADVIKTRGMTKRILFICYAFVLGNLNQDVSITLSSEVGTGSRQENVPKRETSTEIRAAMHVWQTKPTDRRDL